MRGLTFVYMCNLAGLAFVALAMDAKSRTSVLVALWRPCRRLARRTTDVARTGARFVYSGLRPYRGLYRPGPRLAGYRGRHRDQSLLGVPHPEARLRALASR